MKGLVYLNKWTRREKLFKRVAIWKDFANKAPAFERQDLYRHWILEDQKEPEYSLQSYLGLFCTLVFYYLNPTSFP